jgi:AraC-like DNA-binding protein
MLTTHTLLGRDGVALADVVCRNAAGRGEAGEHAGAHMLVFVRRGCFTRSVDGVQTLLDPTSAYVMNPGEEQRYDHPHPHGDDCTALRLDPGLVASLWGGDPCLPSGQLRTSPQIDLEHRLLLAAGRRGTDPHEVVERAIALAARALGQADPRRVASGSSPAARSGRALVDGVREALAAQPERSLPELASMFAVSPHHLSRSFRAVTGHTISRHRMRLRTRAALERLAGGERHLGQLAADLGFADHSHLCRVLHSEIGHTPSALRRALAATLDHI